MTIQERILDIGKRYNADPARVQEFLQRYEAFEQSHGLDTLVFDDVPVFD